MGSSTLRILSAPSSDTSEVPTVILQCDATKYLFNAGEGTTRASAQRKSSNARVEHIFLARVASETLGGMPGLLMTMADSGKNSVNVYGPPNTRYALATTRFYAKRDTMQVGVHDVALNQSNTPCFQDEHVAIHAVPLVPDMNMAKHQKGPSYTPESEPWRNTQWNPSVLSGADADRWYGSVLEDAWGARYAGDARARTPSRMPHALPLPPISPSSTPGLEAGRQAPVLCYIGAGATQRGKFDARRAAALGIAPGPDFARLTRGEDVRIQRPVNWAALNETERSQWLRSRSSKRTQKAQGQIMHAVPEYTLEEVVLHSRDVVGSARAGFVFFYMTLPTPAYIDALLTPEAQAAFAPYTLAANAERAPEQRTTPHVMVHAAPCAVLQDPRYRAWMDTFGPDCYHLFANREQCADRLMYTSSALTLLRLSRLDPSMYSVPGYTLEPAVPCAGGRTMPAAEDLSVPLQPRAPPAVLPGSAPPFNAPLQEMESRLTAHATPEAVAAWTQYEAAVAQAHAAPLPSGSSPADELTFTTLGTGSSSPSKYRNVLSTLVHVPKLGYLLLDAGEGTYFQLARRFGPGARGWNGVGIETILRKLRMIFVSHIHGDHHMGVARILLERRKLQPEHPLYFFSNNYTRFYLREYNQLELLGFDEPNGVVALDNEDMDFQHGVDPETGIARGPPSVKKELDAAKALLQMRAIRTAPVEHRTSHCYALILEHASGWKLVFSGDTMPCAALVAAGKNATVLIHEATMQDDEQELAQAKGHSTVGQAVQAAQKMHAKHLLLTHFSQRYPKFARINTGSSGLPIGIAFDMMHITPKQIRQGKDQLPALQALFAAEHQNDSDTESETLSLPPPKRPREQTHTVRKNEKDFRWRYVVLSLYVPSSYSTSVGSAPVHPPSELSVQQGIAEALQSMHGLVGAAFTVDVLYVGPPLGVQDATHVADAVVRVPAPNVDTVLGALSGIEPRARAMLTGGQGMRVSVQSVSHNLTMLTSNARAWIASQIR